MELFTIDEESKNNKTSSNELDGSNGYQAMFSLMISEQKSMTFNAGN